MKIKAFTLAEILIALIIVGIVSAAVIGSVSNNYVKNTNKKAFQKCYSHMSQTITDMLNDKLAYPDIPISESNLNPIGLANNYTEDGTLDSYKFYNEFKSRTLGAIETTPSGGYFFGDKHFIAQDKSLWWFSNSASFTNDYFMVVHFDVNGQDKGPNCPIIVSPSEPMPTSCTDPDRFMFYISSDGRITPAASSGWNSTTQSKFLHNNGYLGTNE